MLGRMTRGEPEIKKMAILDRYRKNQRICHGRMTRGESQK
jgi:hypothetical protein